MARTDHPMYRMKYLKELIDSKLNFILTTHCDQDYWIAVVLYRQVVILVSLGWNEGLETYHVQFD